MQNSQENIDQNEASTAENIGQSIPKKNNIRLDDWTTLRVVKLIAILFPALIFYIYNSLHTAKAIKKKSELSKILKEYHSERISLESEITKASKQTQIAEKLKSTGLKEITSPPIKITRDKQD